MPGRMTKGSDERQVFYQDLESPIADWHKHSEVLLLQTWAQLQEAKLWAFILSWKYFEKVPFRYLS